MSLKNRNNRVFPEDLGGLLKRAVFSTDGRWLAASGTVRLGVWDFNHGGQRPWRMKEEAREFSSPPPAIWSQAVRRLSRSGG